MEENKTLVLSEWEKPLVLKKRIQKMLEIQQNVMKRGVDYDIIPGCKKPSLMKPGGELLMVTFKLSDRITYNKTIGEDGSIDYEVITNIYTQNSDVYLGCGAGSASTNEEKYKWRKAVCPEEYDDTPDHLKRTKWFKADQWHPRPYKVQQIRTNPSDVANTVFKMAKKRSKLDGVMSTTAASRIYTQDLEDMAGELQEILKDTTVSDNPKTITKPTTEVKNNVHTSSSGTDRPMPTEEERKKGGYVTEKQGWLILRRIRDQGIDENVFLKITKKKSIFYFFKRKDIMDKLLNKIETDPGYFKGEDKKEQPPQTVEEPEKIEEMPVLDQETFLSGVEAMVKAAGFDNMGAAELALQLNVGYAHFKDVPASEKEQQAVFGWLNSLTQGA